MTMADRIVVMHSGNIEQVGTPLELYDHPANLFVAGFIGSPAMNIVGGSVIGSQFRFADGTSIDLGTVPPGVIDGPITLGLRPEHMRLDPAGTMAEVIVIEPTGSETQVTLRLGGQDLVGVFRERISARPGQSIGIGFDQSLLHLFDTETGKRIVR
jgi:multiple sugar transport system ATP-binding protein